MRSYWLDTATPLSLFPPLALDASCDIAIIGGGYTGLATANELLESGVDTVIIDANEIGWGASGRNGGSATPRYKMGFSDLVSDFGHATAMLLHRRLHEGLDTIERNTARYEISCDFERCGQVTAAHSRKALVSIEADIAWLRSIGDSTPRSLDADETRERIGLSLYRGAYLDRRGARIHPLNYARGLARGLVKQGVHIHDRTAATAIRESNNGVVIETSTGAILRAKKAILATDAYLPDDLLAGDFRQHFLTVASAIIVTEPLGESALRAINPGRHVVADTFSLLNYFMLLPDGRLMFGGRGQVSGVEDKPEVFQLLERRMRSLFPAVGNTPVSHRWSGMVGLTQDNLPHAVQLGDFLFAGFGYGGRGVVPAHIIARALAGLVTGRREDFGPLVGNLPARFRFHGLKRRAMGLAVFYLGMRDRIEMSK